MKPINILGMLWVPKSKAARLSILRSNSQGGLQSEQEVCLICIRYVFCQIPGSLNIAMSLEYGSMRYNSNAPLLGCKGVRFGSDFS